MDPENSPAITEALPRLPLGSMQALFEWYERHLCHAELRDPRGYRVCFTENEFVHLVKLTDKYGNEPKNKRLAIQQVRKGRFPMRKGEHPNHDVERVQNLVLAAALVQKPDFIIPSWQATGKAYPGEVYVRDFGTSGRKKYCTLVCLLEGTRRIPVTMFHKQSITHLNEIKRLWP